MNVEGVEKKLREARFFLDRMSEHERMPFDNKEPFDFYLSAFLGAGRTVDYRLRHEAKLEHFAVHKSVAARKVSPKKSKTRRRARR